MTKKLTDREKALTKALAALRKAEDKRTAQRKRWLDSLSESSLSKLLDINDEVQTCRDKVLKLRKPL